ncbi:hypothetical protein [Mycoplasmopsis synoviae]|nr:hypothetical protein [Mycoplasmopsis synoviae]
MWFTSGSVTKAKSAKDDAQYDSVDATLKTTLEEKYTAATSLLEGETKLKNLDASSNLDTTKATLESAKTALDAAVAAVKPDLEFQKTKTSAAAKVTELDALVNPALKAELQRQVNELTKEQAAQATTMLANLTSLKESLESLQTLVSDGLKMQVDYPQKYYDADNKADFDAALLKASSVFPAFQWTAQSIMVPAPEEGALPNPRAWTKAREKSEFVLQNFVIAPAQTSPTTQSDLAAATAASATVRVANGQAASPETQPAAPTADLASTVSYLKTLDTDLKAQTAALNGETPTTKTAYYKADTGRTLYWDGFMPKIVTTALPTTVAPMNREYNESPTSGYEFWKTRNALILTTWFNQNQDKLSLIADQLTKKLGEEKFKNMTLSNPTITWDEVRFSNRGSNKGYLTPKVTFNLAAKEGYALAQDSATSVTLTIRVLYKDSNPEVNVFQTQGSSPSAAPNGANSANHAQTIKDVNVYLNYTGPAIVLDQAVPAVGTAANTSINGTSNVDGAFNTAFRGNPSSGLLFTNRYPNPLLQSVINYVNKFDPKFRAQLVTDTNGVAITSVQSKKELRIGNLNDLLYNKKVFLQQVHGDSSAVYFAVTAIASNGWLNTFLIRIPLTKFVKPLTVFTAPPASAPTQDSSASNTSPQTTT